MNKANVEDLYKLSPIQQGILFHSLYSPETDVYFEQFNWTFEDGIDIAAFERAWQKVVERHTILRTAFHWEDLDEPLQVVQRRVQVPLEQHDWRGLPAAQQDARLDAYLKADRRRGFDLSVAPLMRLTLIRMGEEVYHFIWSYHHLLIDGWSVPLVREDVFTLYEAFRQGQDSALKHGRPYRDYIVWLRRQRLADAEVFWRQALQGFTAATPLPVGRNPGSAPPQDEDYEMQQIHLSAASTEALQSLARREHFTLGTLVYGAWALLLSRYSGDEDVVFGTTMSGRPADLAGSEAMVGVFINTLPMRPRAAPGTPLLTWLRQLQKQQVEMRQYAYAPLVEIQRWSDVPRGLPLFESIVVFENFPSNTIGSRQNLRAFQRTNYPLTLVAEPGTTLMLRLVYDRRRFDAPAIARMLRHLETALESSIANPEQRLADVPILADVERRQLLVEWNDTARPYPQHLCIQGLFEAQAAYTPDAVALVFAGRPTTGDTETGRPGDKETRRPGGEPGLSPQSSVLSPSSLTYAELDRRANQLARHLRSLGVGPEVRVGICMERTPELAVALLGVLKAGGAYVPLDPAYPQERLAFMLDDARAPVLLTNRGLGARDLGLGTKPPAPSPTPIVVCLDADWPQIAQPAADAPVATVDAANLAYLIYTSGSTGRPKGVAITHRSAVAMLHWTRATFSDAELAGMLAATSICFDLSVFELFGPLSWGGTVILADNVLALPDLPAAHAVTLVNTVPSAMHELLQLDRLPDSVQTVALAGEPLPLRLVEQLYARPHVQRVYNLYGPSEDTTYSTGELVPRAAATPPTIGRPIANSQAYVLDAQLRPAPIGVPGELYLGGDGLARGYLDRPDLTAERFVPNPFADYPGTRGLGRGTRDEGRGTWDKESYPKPLAPSPQPHGHRLYRTGDMVRYLPTGDIEFLGRMDHQVKVRGFRIELGEIEAVLGQHPAIRESVVVAREDVPGDKRLVAYFVQGSGVRGQGSEAGGQESEVGDPERSIDPRSPIPDPRSLIPELRAFLQDRLPAYMIPAAFVPLDALPLMANGKLDRRALPVPDMSRPEPGETFVPPSTLIEEQLVEIWRRVLGIEEIGIYDNFFALGGDSIRSLQVIARANQIGLRLTPGQLFQYRTVAELARVARPAQVLPTVEEASADPIPLTPIQHWFFAQDLPAPQHWNQALLLTTQPPLAPALLARALRHLLRHHSALRLRFTLSPAGWQQQTVAPTSAPAPLTCFDLSALPAPAQAPALTAAAAALQASLDLATGPLLRLALFDLGPSTPARLLLVAHHLVVDAVSWGILLDDLASAYAQLQRGANVALPPTSTPFQHWAARLPAYAESAALRQEAAFWLALAQTSVPPLPRDQMADPPANTEATARAVRRALTEAETRALLEEVPRAYQTQVVEVLLTALVEALAPWTGARALLLDLEGHGRAELFEDVDLSRTVGWFTALFPLRLDLSGIHEPGAALKAVKEQLRQVPRRGVGYGVLRYLSADAELRAALATQPAAEVSFTYLGELDQALPAGSGFALASESAGAPRDGAGRRAYLLELNGRVAGGQLRLEWVYSTAVHRAATVERLAEALMVALRDLIAHCLTPDAGGYTPSDVAEFQWSQADLDKITSVIGKTI